jgi:creatinine amidohydrolase
MRSGYWQDLTTRDFDGLESGSTDPERTIAVLPVAAIEQHGPHLPLATDALINAGICRAMLPQIPEDIVVLVLPALDYGASSEHEDFPGTLAIDSGLVLSLWLDITRNVARTGIRKSIILNSHGGQKSLVDQAALRLRIDHEMLAVRCNYFSFGAPEGLFTGDELAFGLHGGEVETSLLLHLHPELVRMDRCRDFASAAASMAQKNKWLGFEKPIGLGWKAQDLNPEGVVGNAARADAERGAAYLAHIARSLAELVVDAAETPLSLFDGGR